MKKALSMEILGYKGEIELVEDIWTLLSKADLYLGKRYEIWWILRDIKQILTSLGEVSECLGENEEGEVRHASLELLQMENCLILVIWIDLTLENIKMDHNSSFCHHKTTYPAYLPSILSSFWFGCTWTSKPSFTTFLLAILLSTSTLIASKGSD